MSILLLILVILSLSVTQMLMGGNHIAFCLPGYGLLALAALLSWWPRRRTLIPRGATECLVAALLFCAYISIRALFSPEQYLARTDLYNALAGVLLYLLVALNLTSARWRLLLVGAILVLAVINCAIGAVQFTKGEFVPFSFLPHPVYRNRASGFYGYPNHLSGFLEIALMLGLGVAFWSRCASWVKVLAGYISGATLLGILITGSRGGYISTTVGLLVFALLSLVLVGKLASGRLLGVLFASLLIISGVAWGVKQVMWKSSFLQTRAEQTLTVDASRMRLWQAAWKQFRLQPVVGTGSGTYLYYGRQFRNPAIHTDPIHAHNDYFELLGEYGIIGLICAVIFVETHLRRGWSSLTRRVEEGSIFQGIGSNSLALTIGALSAAAACLTHCLLDFNLHIPANLLTAAVVFGLLSTPGEGPETHVSEEEPGLSPLLRLGLPVLGILTLVRILPTAPAEYFAERARALIAQAQRPESVDLNIALESIAQRGLTWNPHDPFLHYAMATALATQGDLASDPTKKEAFYTEAVESYRQQVAAAPGDVYALLALAQGLDTVKQFAESEPIFARAVELDPKGGFSHLAYGQHFFLQDKLAEAETQFHLAFEFGAWEPARFGLNQVQDKRREKTEGASPAPATN
ncbi:O-antigen polymerase [Chthoniobacter flavus Ellin428]|uniref:O-antigen polymerase n=1 Tax=Chthoniobacter flavus Ellin428 TaxID=497964 RepID=B4DAG7_9BACT|nr:O-antigen ligase family protein [Chthoniobacter flavus]EDY16628.1 O-antigen polymerase [Chthoniobacter flavus Ellin428]TCO91953.1 O-antigen ligase [Chthoniobacter flavus]